MVFKQLAFDNTVSYTQQWKSNLADVMAWEIEPLTFRLGVRLLKKVRHSINFADTKDEVK